MDSYLIKYLRDNSENELSKKYIDFLKVELDCILYISETIMSKSYHRDRITSLENRLKKNYQYTNALLCVHNRKESSNKKVLSTLKLQQKDISSLSKLGYDFFSPIWHPLRKKNIFGDFKTLKWHKNIQKKLKTNDFHSFLEPEFHNELEVFQEHLLTAYTKQDFRALFLYTDQYFYSKYSIDIFKKMNRPSFVFSHGMPGIYSLEVDNRSDYLMVWSEKIKQNYINAGFESSKVKVVGNPNYQRVAKHKIIRSDLSNVLVIPLTSAVWVQHEYDKTVVTDNGATILYLYKVQTVLKKLGVKKARYRPHPTMNKQWVHSFLDQDFYTCDTENFNDSLNRSSLVIGTNSTLVLESLIHGVNYILFDPKNENGINMSGHKSVPPFDGSEEKLVVVNTEDDLFNALKNNALTNYDLVNDYIQDYDLSVLKELID
jgi:3D (Asp-Asp-Asp) domain-containing protein